MILLSNYSMQCSIFSIISFFTCIFWFFCLFCWLVLLLLLFFIMKIYGLFIAVLWYYFVALLCNERIICCIRYTHSCIKLFVFCQFLTKFWIEWPLLWQGRYEKISRWKLPKNLLLTTKKAWCNPNDWIKILVRYQSILIGNQFEKPEICCFWHPI